MFPCRGYYTILYACIYIYIQYIRARHCFRLKGKHLTEILGPAGRLFHFGGLFVDKTVRGSRSGDGPQQAGSNTAIESFLRCMLVEI